MIEQPLEWEENEEDVVGYEDDSVASQDQEEETARQTMYGTACDCNRAIEKRRNDN